MKRVLLADDHPIVRHGLRSVIAETADMRVAVEVERGDEVLRGLAGIDVAVLDISIPGKGGLTLLKEWPIDGPPVVMLTMHHDYVRAALELGARGYLVKEDATAEIVDCLRSVLAGEVYVSQSVRQPAASLADLTEAERRVLRLVAKHQTSREIADALGIQLRTVQNHRANVVAKLGLRGPGALLQFVLAHEHEL
ncbi:MAG: response regulator transcription factor [Myxococcota bacterium]